MFFLLKNMKAILKEKLPETNIATERKKTPKSRRIDRGKKQTNRFFIKKISRAGCDAEAEAVSKTSRFRIRGWDSYSRFHLVVHRWRNPYFKSF